MTDSPATLGLSGARSFWMLEPELAGPRPRAVKMKAEVGRKIIFWISVLLGAVAIGPWTGIAFALALAIIALSVLLGGLWPERISRGLIAQGVPTKGTIEDVTTGSSRSGVHHRLRIGYDSPAGHLALVLNLREASTASAAWNPFDFRHLQGAPKPGRTLTVLYDPDTPQRALAYEYCVFKAL
jgi:hypothetical protein